MNRTKWTKLDMNRTKLDMNQTVRHETVEVRHEPVEVRHEPVEVKHLQNEYGRLVRRCLDKLGENWEAGIVSVNCQSIL